MIRAVPHLSSAQPAANIDSRAPLSFSTGTNVLQNGGSGVPKFYDYEVALYALGNAKNTEIADRVPKREVTG